MFQDLNVAPKDAILGLSEAFQQDPNPHKINLSVGVYKDAEGRTPVLPSVKEAERRLVETEKTKTYLDIAGSPEYGRLVQNLVFGPEHEAVTSGRVATAHTPGGTGALRVAADFLKTKTAAKRVWLSEPTWPNHPSVFQAAGLETATYPYFDAARNALALDSLLLAIDRMPEGDVLLVHGCCHNPTGIDPTPAEWEKIAAAARMRGLLPLLDFAYQGFGSGLKEDAAALLAFAQPGTELIVASSFSKNFGLYNERVGALSVMADSRAAAEAVLSHVKQCIRSNYSNPPAHGALVVSAVLKDAELSRQWEQEVAQMRERILEMRRLFVSTLAKLGVGQDFSFLNDQRGMFSFSGLSPQQVDRLRDEFAIYIVRSGRINVAGMTEANMPRLCEAIAAVIG